MTLISWVFIDYYELNSLVSCYGIVVKFRILGFAFDETKFRYFPFIVFVLFWISEFACDQARFRMMINS